MTMSWISIPGEIRSCCCIPVQEASNFGIGENTTPASFDALWKREEQRTPDYCIHALVQAVLRNNIPVICHIVIKNPKLLHSEEFFGEGCTILSYSIAMKKDKATIALNALVEEHKSSKEFKQK
jgi:hypothetical protein